MRKLPLDIITPTLNAGNFVGSCILSTSNLRNSGARHIIVDSGSTDGTLVKVRSAGINLIYHPPGNMYSAINRGISETDSEWITYLNGDDIIFPDAITSALESAAGNVDVIYGNIDYIDHVGRFLHHWKSAQEDDFRGLFGNRVMPFPQPGTLFRRSLWEKLHGFNEGYMYSADFDFFLRAFLEGARFKYFKNFPVAAFRLHQSQISQKYVESMHSEVRQSIMHSGLQLGWYETVVVKAKMRYKNLNSYLSRILRYSHIYQKLKIPRTIE